MDSRNKTEQKVKGGNAPLFRSTRAPGRAPPPSLTARSLVVHRSRSTLVHKDLQRVTRGGLAQADVQAAVAKHHPCVC